MEVMSKINLNKQLRMEKPHVVVKEEEEEDEEFDQHQQLEDHDKKKKGIVGGSGSVKRSGTSGGGTRCCQADRCPADLSDAKQYHRRHKVCDLHSKAQVVLVSGLRQRFCQQCSRLGLSNFLVISICLIYFFSLFFVWFCFWGVEFLVCFTLFCYDFCRKICTLL